MRGITFFVLGVHLHHLYLRFRKLLPIIGVHMRCRKASFNQNEATTLCLHSQSVRMLDCLWEWDFVAQTLYSDASMNLLMLYKSISYIQSWTECSILTVAGDKI